MLYSPIVECSKTRSCKYSEKFFSPVGLILFTNTASPITNHQPLDVATHSPRKSTKSDFFLDQHFPYFDQWRNGDKDNFFLHWCRDLRTLMFHHLKYQSPHVKSNYLCLHSVSDCFYTVVKESFIMLHIVPNAIVFFDLNSCLFEFFELYH